MSDSDFEIFWNSLSDELRIICIGALVFVAVLIFVVCVKLYQIHKKKRRQKELEREREMQFNNSAPTPAYSTHCESSKIRESKLLIASL